jgi:hypothetical protein
MTELVFESPRYRLEVAPDGLLARLFTPACGQLASLRPLAALDTVDGQDETLAASVRRVDDSTFVVERRSTRWDRASTTLVCGDDAIEVRTSVAGHGDLADVHLLAARSLRAGGHLGYLPSGASFRTLFSPSPSDPARPLRPASEPALIGVLGDSEPGRRHWLFTPAPLSFALTTAGAVDDPAEPVPEGWVTFSLAAPVRELGFVRLAYVPAEGGFELRLEYEGHTRVEGEFDAPVLVVGLGAQDPYDGLRRHRDDLVSRGVAPKAAARETPAWWREPIFCGWGAQCALASSNGRLAADYATQASYDAFLGRLESEGVVPGTVVLDDKWQAEYGTNEPDPAKWPDLGGWIADRHARGQHVLLWWKAWDAEGARPELCVHNPDGVPVALDPSNPATREFLEAMLARLLGPDGLGADGLKVDFTARTPSGRGLTHRGPGWGIALLHELLRTVYDAAKAAKPDALVITHTPHPSFVDVTDMIRLNDMTSGTPVSEQMRERADVVRAACPELLIDTDDWRVPNLEEWRTYLALKTSLGVPSLYYADALDASGEQLEAADYAALRETWTTWRSAR